MKFKHLAFEYDDNIDDENVNNILDNNYHDNFQNYRNPIILLDDNLDDDVVNNEEYINYRILAQAISLDIRGEFGLFINNSTECDSFYYEWTGNMFNIIVNKNQKVVVISDLTDEENKEYVVDFDEWQEALLDWKQFYLETLGFLEFKSKSLCHMMGVLILTFDQMSNDIFSSEMITESIKKCAERYGVNKSVIYRDCRKVTGLYNISDFCLWTKGLLLNKLYLCKFSDFAFYNIDKQNDHFRVAIKKYLNIEL